MEAAPTNGSGWTRTAEAWVAPWIDDQLTDAGIAYETLAVPTIMGMGGEARVLRYQSPATGLHVAVLVLPLRPDIDSVGQRCYYFEAPDRTAHVAVDWLKAYRTILDIEDEHGA